MACQTCDHTMQGLGNEWFWCPRCGTIKGSHEASIEAPMLVGRVREFMRCASKATPDAVLSLRLGITESIDKPAERLRYE